MATFIQTNELTGTAKPATAGTLIRDEQFGIDATLSGYISQDVQINCNRITDTTQDQKGAVCSQLDYDEQHQGTMTVIGGSDEDPAGLEGLEVGSTDFSWAGHKWKITGVQYTGNFQSKKQYQISFERYRNWPSQS